MHVNTFLNISTRFFCEDYPTKRENPHYVGRIISLSTVGLDPRCFSLAPVAE